MVIPSLSSLRNKFGPKKKIPDKEKKAIQTDSAENFPRKSDNTSQKTVLISKVESKPQQITVLRQESDTDSEEVDKHGKLVVKQHEIVSILNRLPLVKTDKESKENRLNEKTVSPVRSKSPVASRNVFEVNIYGTRIREVTEPIPRTPVNIKVSDTTKSPVHTQNPVYTQNSVQTKPVTVKKAPENIDIKRQLKEKLRKNLVKRAITNERSRKRSNKEQVSITQQEVQVVGDEQEVHVVSDENSSDHDVIAISSADQTDQSDSEMYKAVKPIKKDGSEVQAVDTSVVTKAKIAKMPSIPSMKTHIHDLIGSVAIQQVGKIYMYT